MTDAPHTGSLIPHFHPRVHRKVEILSSRRWMATRTTRPTLAIDFASLLPRPRKGRVLLLGAPSSQTCKNLASSRERREGLVSYPLIRACMTPSKTSSIPQMTAV